MSGTWSTLIVSALCEADVRAVWCAIAEPEYVSDWFTKCEIVRDGVYRLTFDEGGESYTKHVVITECTEIRGFRFVLIDPGEVATEVEVRVDEISLVQTQVALTHRASANLASDYWRGWSDYLNALARFVQVDAARENGGVDRV